MDARLAMTPSPWGEGRGEGSPAPQLVRDLDQYSFDVLQDVIVPEADEPMALVLKPSCSFIVPCLLSGMLPSIDFDDEALLHAEKIDDITAQRALAAKLMAAKLPVTQVTPEQCFRIRPVAAQGSCTVR